jgi:hypothetical protein
MLCNGFFADAVNGTCFSEESKSFFYGICDRLPDEGCFGGPDALEEKARCGCGKDEFDCGDGICISGLQLCDNKADCLNGADELAW